MRRVPRGTTPIAIGGVIAVTLYAVAAALQILVLTPLAVAPGRSLGEIRAEMDAAGEGLGEAGTLVILGLGVAIAVITAVTIIRSRVRPAPAAIFMLALLAAGGPAFFIASFGPGMSLADTYFVSAGITLPGVLPFYAVSALAAAAAVVVALGGVARERRIPASV